VSKNAFSWFLTDILEVHSLEEIKNARGRYGRRSQGYWRTVNAGYKKCRDSSSDRVSTEVEQLKKKQNKGHRRENVLLHGMMTRLWWHRGHTFEESLPWRVEPEATNAWIS